MTLWNAQFRENDESPVLERADVSAELFGVPTERHAHQNVAAARARAARTEPAEAPEPARRGHGEDDERSDVAANDNVDLVTNPARPDPGFSRDLVDTYFRQMGNAELLTRE